MKLICYFAVIVTNYRSEVALFRATYFCSRFLLHLPLFCDKKANQEGSRAASLAKQIASLIDATELYFLQLLEYNHLYHQRVE
jgi:hypothetical protein